MKYKAWQIISFKKHAPASWKSNISSLFMLSSHRLLKVFKFWKVFIYNYKILNNNNNIDLSVCLSVCLSVILCLLSIIILKILSCLYSLVVYHLYIILSFCGSIYLSIHPSIRPSVRPSFSVFCLLVFLMFYHSIITIYWSFYVS